jgi:hypothetical protein
VSLEIPFSSFLPDVVAATAQRATRRRSTRTGSKSGSNTQYESQMSSPQTSLQELFLNIEQLISQYFLHVTLLITDEDLAQYSLADMASLYQQIHHVLSSARERCASHDRTALGVYISVHMPLYPVTSPLQPHIADAAISGEDDITAELHDISQSLESQSIEEETAMIDSSNLTEKLIDIVFRTNLANINAQKKKKLAQEISPGLGVGPILKSPKDKVDDDDQITVPHVHCIVFDLLQTNYEYAYAARILALQQHVAQITHSLSPTPALSTRRSLEKQINDHLFVGSLNKFDHSPELLQENAVGTSTKFVGDKQTPAQLTNIQIGNESCSSGNNYGISFGFSGFTSHDHVDSFIQRNHGKFRIDFIHLTVVELPNLRTNTIELCHRNGINVLVSIDDEVFDAVINAEEVEEVEEQDVNKYVVEQERGGEGNTDCEEEEEEEEEEDNSEITENDNKEQQSSMVLITEVPIVSATTIQEKRNEFQDASKVFDEDVFFTTYDTLAKAYDISLQMLIVQALRQFGCIVRIKGVFNNPKLANGEDVDWSGSTGATWRAHYVNQHYGRLVHPFVDRKLFVSHFRVVSLHIQSDHMESIRDLSASEEGVDDRMRVQTYLTRPTAKVLDFALLDGKHIES